MTLQPEAPQEIRCECSRHPLLGKAGIEHGEPFLWIKHMKASRVITNVKLRGGKVEIECRECRRIWRITLDSVMQITQSWQ